MNSTLLRTIVYLSLSTDRVGRQGANITAQVAQHFGSRRYSLLSDTCAVAVFANPAGQDRTDNCSALAEVHSVCFQLRYGHRSKGATN